MIPTSDTGHLTGPAAEHGPPRDSHRQRPSAPDDAIVLVCPPSDPDPDGGEPTDSETENQAEMTVIEEDGCFAVLQEPDGGLLITERLHDHRGPLTWRMPYVDRDWARATIDRLRPRHDRFYHDSIDWPCSASVDMLAEAIERMADLLDCHAEGLDVEDRRGLIEGVEAVRVGARHLRRARHSMHARLEA